MADGEKLHLKEIKVSLPHRGLNAGSEKSHWGEKRQVYLIRV